MITWNVDRPKPGHSVLLKLSNGSVHEGHFIKNANKLIFRAVEPRSFSFVDVRLQTKPA